jgi:predicted RNase H-like HicB family nuclease
MTYRVVIERDETGAWLARVPSISGCHTYGRTLEQARRRIRETLELWVDDAEKAELSFDVRIPTAIRREVRLAQDARDRSRRAKLEASDTLRRAALDLTQKAGLSLRDAADLLDISHQRVQQLIISHPENRRANRRRSARSA